MGIQEYFFFANKKYSLQLFQQKTLSVSREYDFFTSPHVSSGDIMLSRWSYVCLFVSPTVRPAYVRMCPYGLGFQ